MRDARDELIRRQSRRPDGWTWGHLHQLDAGEPAARPVRHRAGRADVQPRRAGRLGGGPPTVDATGWNAAEGYAVTAAPSMRMVVSLADLDSSRWINLTGAWATPSRPLPRPDRPVGRAAARWRGRSARRRGRAAPDRLVTPAQAAARPRPGDPARGERRRHGTVVGLGAGPRRAPPRRTARRAHERADRHPAQRPVVGAAAPAEAQAVEAHGQTGDEHHVGGRDARPAPSGGPTGSSRPRPAGPRLAGSRVGRPVEVVVGLQERQHDPRARATQRVEQRAGAGLGADRDVRRDGGRAAYLVGGQGDVARGRRRARRISRREASPPRATSWSRSASLAVGHGVAPRRGRRSDLPTTRP